MPRSEEDVLAGVLHISIGGERRAVPVRTVAAARAWKAELSDAIAHQVGAMNLETLEDVGTIAGAVGDRMLELVASYDEKSVLGGLAYLEDHATDEEVYAAFTAMVGVTYPFAGDLPALVVVLQSLAGTGLSLGPRSISPSSANGTSPVLAGSSSS